MRPELEFNMSYEIVIASVAKQSMTGDCFVVPRGLLAMTGEF